MANQTTRLKPAQLKTDRDDFAALQAVAGYAPANEAYALPALEEAYAELQSARAAEVQAETARAAARDNVVAKEWKFHNLMLGARDQIIALFGRDSNEAQAVGRKKPSEFKVGRRRGGGPAASGGGK